MALQESVLVIGGTGTQGSSVARALLGHPMGRYSVRILTRRPNGPTSQQLQKLGAEMCVGDLDDKESISRAINGVNVIFVVTTHNPVDGDWRDELRQGVNFIETLESIVKASTTKAKKTLVVFSTLPSLSGFVDEEEVEIISEFIPKVMIEERLRESALIDSIFVTPGYYAENFQKFWPPYRKYAWLGPLHFCCLLHKQKVFHSIVMERDFGRAVVALMERKSEFSARTEPIYISTEFLTLDEELHIMGKVVGEDIQHDPLSGQELSVLPKKLRALLEFHSKVEEPEEFTEILRNGQKLTLELLGNEFDSFEEWCMKNKETLRAGSRSRAIFRNTLKASALIQKNWPYLLVITVAVVGGSVLGITNRKKS